MKRNKMGRFNICNVEKAKRIAELIIAEEENDNSFQGGRQKRKSTKLNDG
jgi:hypothetical protein